MAILAVAAGIIVVAAVVIVGLKLRHGSPAAAPTASVQPAVVASTPAAGAAPGVAVTPSQTVQAYFRAINHHRYGRAWRLGGKNTADQSYARFASGFADTAHDAVQIESTAGDVVTARLTATQTDGTVKTYDGTYTVSHGQIVTAVVRQTS